MLTEKTVHEFLNELGSSSPAPGGGSTSALAGALGAGLISMVCRLTIGKKKYADVQAEMESVLQQSERLRAGMARLVDEDTEVFKEVMAAFGLPKESSEEQEQRTAAIQAATKKATLVPLNLMKLTDEAITLAKIVAEKGNKNSVSDAGVAALMLQAACSGAALNVRINLGSLKDESFVQETAGHMKGIAQRVEAGVMETLIFVNKSVT